MNDRCYVLAGGGTGGHVTPGLAVAAELRRRDPRARCVFVGSTRPLERELVGSAGFDHVALPTESLAMLRRNPLKFFWNNWRAWTQMSELFQYWDPTVVIGLGGYASAPGVLAGLQRKRPVVLLEQNVIPGNVTRRLAPRVHAVCTSFRETQQYLARGNNVEWTGNPVAESVAALCARPLATAERRGPTVLVLGGSQGAVGLNRAVVAWVERWGAELAGWRIVHQTGEEGYAAVERAYREVATETQCAPFFRDVTSLYLAADMVISRAGATTLAELACAGLPSILVPYPHAASDHQRLNAEVFVAAGASQLVAQQSDPEATASLLRSAAVLWAQDPRRRLEAARGARGLARPGAAAAVAAKVASLADAAEM